MGNCECWPKKPDYAARVNDQANRVIGNLNYLPGDGTIEKCDRILSRMQEGKPVEQMKQCLVELRELKSPPRSTLNVRGRTRLVMFTDLEPDDTMAIAQLWQRRIEKGELDGEPLIIYNADFEAKEDPNGKIFEKKLLVAALMLGHYTYHILTKASAKNYPSLPEPKKEIMASRDRTLEGICDNLANFNGENIDLFVIAPGFGNLGGILAKLKARNAWPLRARFRVSMYSGAYNMKAMTDSDIAALKEFVGHGVLMDVGKFPFFGGKDCHEWADSLTTFALPRFAADISVKAPLLAAALKLFNDEMNESLVSPFKDSLFKGSTLDDQDKAALTQLKTTFQRLGINAYAKELASSPLFAKVAGFKKSTLKAFAAGGCDSPLCDQLLFLAEWLLDEQKTWVTTTSGAWEFDKDKGFTTIVETPQENAMRGSRPTLSKPKDEASLLQMRAVLEHYLRKHVDSLRVPV